MKEMKTGTKVLIGIAGTYLGLIIYTFMGIELAKTSIPALPRMLITEVFFTVVAVALVIILKRQNIYKCNAEDIKAEFTCIIPCVILLLAQILGFLCSIILGDYSAFEGVTANTLIINIILLIIFTALVGVAEETLFRGIIFNELRDLWGRNSLKGFYLATVVSAILFGGSHLTNLIKGANFAGVLVQIIGAGISGLLYCAIYYRTNSMWPIMIYHGLNDFVEFTKSGMLSGVASSSDVVSSYQFTPAAFLMPMVDLAFALILLRKKKVEPLLEKR